MLNVIKGSAEESGKYHRLCYDGISISGEVFVSAVLFDPSGARLIELGDLIEEPEWDKNGDYTGLIAGLIACSGLGIKDVVLVGGSQLQDHEEIVEFMGELFANFNNVCSTIVSRDENAVATLLTGEIITSRKHFIRKL